MILFGVSLLSAAAVFGAGCDNGRKTTAGSAPNTTAGTTVDDSIITTKIKSGLLADPVVNGLDPEIETHNGTVQLSGSVETQAQMDRVVEITRSVNGVTNVENKMKIRK